MVSNLNIGEIDSSSVNEWSVEQFHTILKKYTDQVGIAIVLVFNVVHKFIFYCCSFTKLEACLTLPVQRTYVMCNIF